MRTFILYIIILSSINVTFAQKQETLLQRAEKHYNRQEYVLAIKNYNKVNTLDVSSKYRLGYSYQMIDDYRKALKTYQSIVKVKWEGQDLVFLNYGLMAKAMGLYGKAGDAFKEYLFDHADDKDVRDLYLSCQTQYYDELVKNKALTIVENLSFNTEHKEISPVLLQDGLIYSSSRRDHVKNDIHHRDGNQFLDLHFVQKNDLGVYDETEILHEHVLNNLHVGPSCYDTINNKFYMTVNLKKKKSVDAINNLQIVVSNYDPIDHHFDRPESININNPEYNLGHPTIANDGNTMYFVSDMPGGHGGTDIYKTEKGINGKWTEPENLGDLINTSGNEMFPYVYDDNTLYFSSDRHIGLGGLDIFKAIVVKGEITGIENVGAPINSSTDDFGICFQNPNEGYFTSNRFDGKGDDDIYSFKHNSFDFTVFVIDSVTREPLENIIVECYDNDRMAVMNFETDEKGYVRFNSRDKKMIQTIAAMSSNYKYKEKNIKDRKEERNVVVIELVKGRNLQLIGDVFDSKTHKKIKSAHVFLYDNDSTRIRSIGDVRDGHYSIIITEVPDHHYFISNAEGYITKNMKLINPTPDRFGVIYQDIYLDPIMSENVVDIENIYYPFDSSFLTDKSISTLNEVFALLRTNYDYKVEMQSHCDIRGTEGYNMQLSLERMESAMGYLVRKGISKDRLILGYFGEEVTAIDCKDCSESEHQLNRRTEIKIIR
ncbi:OmpA family protein [Flammeovirga sp. SubArs3]|uniref:OmpA family protein n=1 Tax=Flammeovirga sp. SubArs3 TaxID=2995316 RepID=UPI00248C30ED|nr:OmpA family protein [Flammeovirga sp. SubArs3]